MNAGLRTPGHRTTTALRTYIIRLTAFIGLVAASFVGHVRLAKHEILFAAFGGWDAAGAKAFGYPTVWVNRFNQPLEQLGVGPDETFTDLKGLLEFVLSGAPQRRP